MKWNKLSFILHGIFNVTPIPFWLSQIMVWLPLIGTAEILNVDWILAWVGEPWFDFLYASPFWLPVVSCVIGIVRGAIHFKNNKSARWCLFLSVLGTLLYIGAFLFVCLLSSLG